MEGGNGDEHGQSLEYVAPGNGEERTGEQVLKGFAPRGVMSEGDHRGGRASHVEHPDEGFLGHPTVFHRGKGHGQRPEHGGGQREEVSLERSFHSDDQSHRGPEGGGLGEGEVGEDDTPADDMVAEVPQHTGHEESGQQGEPDETVGEQLHHDASMAFLSFSMSTSNSVK